MAETLSYEPENNTTTLVDNLTPEEQDSLQVGEAISQQEEQTADRSNQSLVDQAGQLAGTPLMDPEKNPDLAEQAAAVLEQITPPQ